MNNNPFAALGALRDSLPDGPGQADEPANESPKALKVKDFKIFYERKGRGGKEVTIIECPDSMTDDDVANLAKVLKNRLGTGGSARGAEILLQGDKRNALPDALQHCINKIK